LITLPYSKTAAAFRVGIGKEPISLAREGYRECPVCGNEVKLKAVFCTSCKSLLKDNVAKQPAGTVSKSASSIPVISHSTYKKSSRSGILKQSKTVEINLDDLYALIQKIYRRASAPETGEEVADEHPEKDKMEAIIRSFADEYAERVAGNVSKSASERDYLIEEKRLEVWMEKRNWHKLNDSSKTLLVSAGLMYNNLLSLSGKPDFSGVCLLAIRALEEEVYRRFYINYIAFLEKLYPGEKNKKYWPTPLLNRYDHKKSTKKYSLIGATYVMCHAYSNSNSARQNETNMARLVEYAEDKLFAAETDTKTIKKIIPAMAEKIDIVCRDYRNPYSVNYRGDKVKAQESLDFLVKVETVLKEMLDSFIA
jgi:hypothetical protein